jgi:hypothetical protein
MSGIVSRETAHRIWMAHREIETATKLLEELRTKFKAGDNPTPLDAFGRHRNFQLGVPSSDSGHRLFDVAPQLAFEIIEAHLVEKKSELIDASAIAKLEALGEP